MHLRNQTNHHVSNNLFHRMVRKEVCLFLTCSLLLRAVTLSETLMAPPAVNLMCVNTYFMEIGGKSDVLLVKFHLGLVWFGSM